MAEKISSVNIERITCGVQKSVILLLIIALLNFEH